MMQNNNGKKDLSKVLSTIDPRLLEKIMPPSGFPEKKPGQEKQEENAADETQPVQSAVGQEQTKSDEAEQPEAETEAQEKQKPVNESLREAEEQAAAILSFEPSQDKSDKKQGSSGIGVEIVILLIISLLLFFVCMHAKLDWLALVAVFLPAIYGILSRLLFRQLSLKEAVSKSKLHIFISCFFMLCAILSV
jgi:Flp pilus assembly protein TadB